MVQLNYVTDSSSRFQALPTDLRRPRDLCQLRANESCDDDVDDVWMTLLQLDDDVTRRRDDVTGHCERHSQQHWPWPLSLF